MNNVNTEFVGYFFEEALELLKTWEDLCGSIGKKTPVEAKDWETLYRVAHNIKGSSKSVGLDSMGEFTRQVEAFVILLRDGKVKLNPDRIALLLEAKKIYVLWIEELKKSYDYEPKNEEYLERLKKSSV